MSISDIRNNGLNPLSYLGVQSYSPANFIKKTFDPTPNDSQNFTLGTIWLNMGVTPQKVWILTSLSAGVATWVMFTGGLGTVISLTGNSGGAVDADGSGNINVVGDGTTITIAGNPGTHTLTASTTGIVADSFPTDSGTATPSAGVLNIITGNSTQNSGSTVLFTGTGNTVELNVTDASNNTFMGKQSGNATLTSVNSTAFGYQAFHALTSGNGTMFGMQAGGAITSGVQNVGFGGQALAAVTTSSNSTAVGHHAFISATGQHLTGVGVGCGSNYTGTESYNTILGSSKTGRVGESNVIRIGVDDAAIPALTDNIFIGNGSGTGSFTVNTAVSNICISSLAFGFLTTGAQNVCAGNGSGSFLTTGSNNTLIGHGTAGTSIASINTGSFNTIVGCTAGSSYTGAESSNITIGNATTGTNGESNVLRIGSGTGTGNGQVNKSFIAGIRGITTGVADAVAVLIDSAGQLGTVSSSERYKENIEDMDDSSESILELRPVTFSYKSDKSSSLQYGLIAEEVADVMPDIVVYDKEGQPETVQYHVLPVLLLNELQKLRKEVEELKESKRKRK